MKSPFTGGNAILKTEKAELEFRREKFQYISLYYLCEDTNERFTTTEIDTINLFCELNDFYLMSVGELLYNQAWDIYESDHIKNKKQYQKKFLCAQQFAYFNQDQDCIHFLKVREEKYLK